LWKNIDAFKQELLTQSGIKSVALSNGTPGMESATWLYAFPGTDISQRSFNTLIIDYDYLNTFGLQMAEGRPLSREFDEMMLEKPIGVSFQALDGEHQPGRIVGVVKDFHYRSLHRKIEPLVIRIDPQNMGCASVKFTSGDFSEHLAGVEKEWKKFVPDYPFVYEFMDETIAHQYKAEQNTGILLTSFASLAIFIACLGLLGLTAFMTEQRKKEIGVRKVLGASISSIVVLLSKDFSKLVLIAFVITMPVAWYAVDKWLEGFAYKVTISPLVFIGAGVLITLIAWLSIVYQATKAAVINPSETLRNE
jgi:putative ABC transport system permease protein